MSNDVHLARVSKIQRSADISKQVEVKNRRCMVGPNTKDSSRQQEKRHSEEIDFMFDSTSPRPGGPIMHLSSGAESPDQAHRDTNESDNNISSCSTLDIGKMENLSLHQLETQVRELSQCLQQAEKQRVELQRQLNESNAEKELCSRRLEVVSAAHESRITEMHCVIAELSKKLRAKQECTIIEEQEPEGSEISYQEGSIYNSELNLTNPDAECQTDPLDEAECSAGEWQEQRRVNILWYDNVNEDSNLCADLSDDIKRDVPNDTINKGQVETLQEEVLRLKAQIALLQSEIANSLRLEGEQVVVEQQSVEFYGEDVEANDSNYSLQQHRYTPKNDEKQFNDLDATTTQSDFMAALKPREPLTSPQKAEPPVPKMAERIKLRCASKAERENVTATDLLNSELKNANIVEHLVSDMKQNNSLMESFIEPSQLDHELQRLQRKVERLKMRNTVLSLTLDECKEHCDHLYLLCGKYESNAIALQSAVNCSDRAIEAYDVMLALLESKLALMKDNSIAAEESRKAVESVARHLLDRLESEKNMCENSLGPWQNTSFSIPDKVCSPWTTEDDNRLRYHVSKLKGRRSTVQNTIVNLESPFSDFYEKSRLALESSKEKCCNQEKTAQLDLEMAVLMQELLNLREENIDLKAKTDEANREREYAVEALKQLQLQLQLTADSNALFNQSERLVENRISFSSEAEHVALTEQQLVEALTRENELKGRLQTLIASVSVSQKIADEKYEQVHNNVKELQKSNLSLLQSLEQCKRKYQVRIRKLEQKVMEMTLQAERQASGGNVIAIQQAPRFKYLKGVNAATHLPHVQQENVPETTL